METQFFICFIIEEILESIRAKKGDIDIVKSPEEIDKDKNETETSNSKDAEKSREEFEDQIVEKDSDDKTPDDVDPEQGKSEGKDITWLKRIFHQCYLGNLQFYLQNENEVFFFFFFTNNYLILHF